MSRVYPNDKPSRSSPEIWFQASSIRRCYRLAYVCLKFTWEGTFILHRHWPIIANTLAFLSGEHDINASPTTIAWLQKFTCSLGWPFVSIVFTKIKVVGHPFQRVWRSNLGAPTSSSRPTFPSHLEKLCFMTISTCVHEYKYIYIYNIIIIFILDIYIYTHVTWNWAVYPPRFFMRKSLVSGGLP